MHSNPLDPIVIIIAIFALSITATSFYISRCYLPLKIKKAYLKSITVLAAAVETRDSGTVGHAQRVAHLTVEIARKLGVKQLELERIEYAALLMDIGKANVPQAILNKRDQLTPEEWESVKSHSRLGAEMVTSIPFLADITDYISYHHEAWDGSGYPEGLTGEDIPLACRILSIAADFDAMICERPYYDRPKNSKEAIEEIKRLSGVKYDPAIVDLFLEVVPAESLEAEEEIAA